MNYKEHENGLIEIYCTHAEIPTLMNLLKLRHSQLEETKSLKRELGTAECVKVA